MLQEGGQAAAQQWQEVQRLVQELQGRIDSLQELRGKLEALPGDLQLAAASQLQQVHTCEASAQGLGWHGWDCGWRLVYMHVLMLIIDCL